MKLRLTSRAVTAFALVFPLLLFCGCKRQPATSETSRTVPSPATVPKVPKTPFENDLDYVRRGQFTYVFVFSRMDGEAFTREDIEYLKANSPNETNQWVSSDEGKRVIAGTNFEFKPENLAALQKRFKIDDFSGK